MARAAAVTSASCSLLIPRACQASAAISVLAGTQAVAETVELGGVSTTETGLRRGRDLPPGLRQGFRRGRVALVVY
jgi:hypothetical protein